MYQSESIKIKLIPIINKDEYSWLILLYASFLYASLFYVYCRISPTSVVLRDGSVCYLWGCVNRLPAAVLMCVVIVALLGTYLHLYFCMSQQSCLCYVAAVKRLHIHIYIYLMLSHSQGLYLQLLITFHFCMASEGLWVVMGVFSYVLSCMLGKERAGFYAFWWFVTCVLFVVICLSFLLVSLIGKFLWLWLFLETCLQICKIWTAQSAFYINL